MVGGGGSGGGGLWVGVCWGRCGVELLWPDVPAPAPSKANLDVSITPSGKFAVVRREGSAQVGIVDLDTSARHDALSAADHRSRSRRHRRPGRGGRPKDGARRDSADPRPAPEAELTITGETMGRSVIAKGGGRRSSTPMRFP